MIFLSEDRSYPLIGRLLALPANVSKLEKLERLARDKH
jgi:hypothetical protein